MALLTAIALFACPSLATAQGELPPGSGVDQYIESLPGAGGGKVPGSGSRGGPRLDPRAERQLRDNAEDRLLRRVASDPQLGAPKDGPGAKGRSGQGTANQAAVARSAPRGSIPAAVGDTFFGSSTGLPVLLGLLLIAAVGGTTAYRRGVRRGSTRGNSA